MTEPTVPYAERMEGIEAREAAVKLLWDKRSMLPEHSEEIVVDVINVVAPYFLFSPLGDNHHAADMCPYCTRSGR